MPVPVVGAAELVVVVRVVEVDVVLVVVVVVCKGVVVVLEVVVQKLPKQFRDSVKFRGQMGNVLTVV